ncbi:MAG TPA: hypothetical protein ENH26_02870 [Candidatus Wolfebacteria bacterium]|nr:hypothetical protein [Candidatus Wolfebacteria bacterium]
MKQLDPKAVWLFFISLVLRWFIFIFIFGFYLMSAIWVSTLSLDFLKWLWIIIPAFLILSWLWAKWTYYFYRYELREDGFRKEFGVIWKHYVTIPYDRIQNVDIYRGVIARILGLSDLQIQTAGTASVTRRGWFGGARAPEGRLRGLSMDIAEQLRDELIKRARQFKTQGL